MTDIEVLTQNINEVLSRLRGEADALEHEHEFRGDVYFQSRKEALRDAAEAIEAAMNADEPMVFDAYQGATG